MNKNLKYSLFFLVINLLNLQHLSAQRRGADVAGNVGYINSLQVSGGLGMASYYGDLCDSWECMRFRYNINGAFIYRASGRIMGRAEINLLKLYGTDEGGKNANRNLNFKSNIFSLEATAIYDLIPYERKYGHRDDFHPYVFMGIGVIRFEPKGELDGKWYKLQPLRTEGRHYYRTSLTMPYGVGIRYMLDKKTNLNFEVGYRMTFTDYLDDVSRTYVDNNSFSDPKAAQLADKSVEMYGEKGLPKVFSDDRVHWNEGHKRGNPRASDGYFTFGVKVEYKIKYTKQHNIKTFKRPKFSN